MKNIYVGNVSYTATNEGLAELFGQYGEVLSAKILIDRETRRSRGFAFVEMSDDEAATAAISALDGADFKGRPLKVNVARERQPR